MSRQLIRYNAVRRADNVDDQLSAATIAAREASSVTQEDLQEGVLSQLKRILVGDDVGSWDQDFVAGGFRALKQLNQDLAAVDRIIIRPRRTQVQTSIAVPVQSATWSPERTSQCPSGQADCRCCDAQKLG